MAALDIVARAAEATVEKDAASIGLTISGWAGRSNPVISPRFMDPSAEQWVSVHLQRSTGARRSGVVTFDPSVGPRPRAGTYPVQLTLTRAGQRASTTVRFVIPRHPCLRFAPRPSWSWDWSTNTLTVSLQLWNCGNVDLNLTWSAQIEDRRLRVHAPAVEVPVDGGPVGATLTIEIPRGEVDVEAGVDLEALSAADRRSWRVPGDRPQLVPRRPQGGRHGGRRARRLTAGLLAVVAAVAGWVVFDAVRDDDGPVVVTDTAAPAPASPESTQGTAPPSSEAPPDTTAQPGTPVPPAAAAHVFVADDPVRELAIAVGQSAEVSFEIGNDGGSSADVGLGDLQGDAFFAIGPGTCGGPLEPLRTCSVAIVFEPAEPGTYETRLVVEDGSTGDELELSVTGIAGTIDLQVEFASDTVRTSGCPGDVPQCLAFVVFNAGTAASPATIAAVGSGGTVLRVDVPPLQAGAQRELLAGTGPSCTNDCGASVAVDPDAVVPESDEQNNEDTYFEVG